MNLTQILEYLYNLTAEERRLVFSQIEELFCLDCGREQRFCTCEMDDRW